MSEGRGVSFVFGPVRPADRETIARLLANDMRDLGMGKTPEDLLAVADLVLEDAGRSSYCLVVRPDEQSQPVGILLANVLFSVKLAGKSLWIENLYVDNAWRRHGLGRTLVEHMLDWAETHNIRGIDLEAYQGNTPAAILYRSLGFERLSRERFWFDFAWVDEPVDADDEL